MGLSRLVVAAIAVVSATEDVNVDLAVDFSEASFSEAVRELASHGANNTSATTNTTASTSEGGGGQKAGGVTTTTTTTTKAFKTTIKGDVTMKTTLPAACQTTADMSTTACEPLRKAFVRGVCKGMKAHLKEADQAKITCPGGTGATNFSGVVQVAGRRLEEASADVRQLAAKDVTVKYTMVVQADTNAMANTIGNGLKQSIETNKAAMAVAIKAQVNTAVDATTFATDVSVDDVSVKAPTAVTASQAQVIDSFALRSVVIGGLAMLATFMW